jgi:hypothetical protein
VLGGVGLIFIALDTYRFIYFFFFYFSFSLFFFYLFSRKMVPFLVFTISFPHHSFKGFHDEVIFIFLKSKDASMEVFN